MTNKKTEPSREQPIGHWGLVIGHSFGSLQFPQHSLRHLLGC